MRIIFAAAIILFCSCQSNSNKDNDATEKRLKAAELEAETSSQTIDSVFVGYRFGMSRIEFIDHTKKLIDSGTLKQLRDGNAYYEFPSHYGDPYKGVISMTFLEDKLITLSLYFEDDQASPIMIFSKVSELYEKKYGAPDFMLSPIENFYEKYWFKDNLKIRLKNRISQTTVEYFDMRYQKQKEKADSLKEASKESKIIEGL